MEFNCTIEGRIVKRAPEMRTSQAGNIYTTLELVHNGKRFRDATGQWRDGKAQWFDVICFGNLASRVADLQQNDIITVTVSRIDSRAGDGIAFTQLVASNVSLSLRFKPATSITDTASQEAVTTADGEQLTAAVAGDPWSVPAEATS
ncbi:single-stranded DNA-binding protein [Haloglycomyces albus]|uniref:single-stranded DNA-binding protein n=1 Tax=Haloglycomyces albus TaxID=526067 RepID=UPI00046D7677|nr:single-stranded DNA-binding protein [Haloglycomyces albus]